MFVVGFCVLMSVIFVMGGVCCCCCCVGIFIIIIFDLFLFCIIGIGIGRGGCCGVIRVVCWVVWIDFLDFCGWVLLVVGVSKVFLGLDLVFLLEFSCFYFLGFFILVLRLVVVW